MSNAMPTGGRWIEYKASDIGINSKFPGTGGGDHSNNPERYFDSDDIVRLYVVDRDGDASSVSNKDVVTHIWLPDMPNHSQGGGWLFANTHGNGTPVLGGPHTTDEWFTIKVDGFKLVDSEGNIHKNSPQLDDKAFMDGVKTITPNQPPKCPPCFGPDVKVYVRTKGEGVLTCVKDLKVGDYIKTRHHVTGEQIYSPVLWLGKRSVFPADKEGNDCPVNVNGELYSQQHRILLEDANGKIWCKAKFLADYGLAKLQTEPDGFCYYHILTTGHRTIVTEHNLVESLLVTGFSVGLFGKTAQEEIERAVYDKGIQTRLAAKLQYPEMTRQQAHSYSLVAKSATLVGEVSAQ